MSFIYVKLLYILLYIGNVSHRLTRQGKSYGMYLAWLFAIGLGMFLMDSN